MGHGHSIRILTYNIFTIFVSPYDKVDRPLQIARLIVDSPYDYDIVCFNEVYLRNVDISLADTIKESLHKILSKKYPSSYYPGSGINFIGSGLAIFSKWKIEQPMFREYDVTNLSLESFAGKGVGYARIQNPNSKQYINVLFTHTNAESSGERREQMGTIKRFYNEIKTKLQIKDDENWFIAGDLNIVGNWRMDRDIYIDFENRDRSNRERPIPAISNEWEGYFLEMIPDRPGIVPHEPTFKPFRDLWYYTTSRADLGITQHSGERLDYILSNYAGSLLGPSYKQDEPYGMLIPHHMQIAYDLFPNGASLSDHRPLKADFNLPQARCIPRWAEKIAEKYISDPLIGYEAPLILGDIKLEGSVQWYLVPKHFSVLYCVSPSCSPGPGSAIPVQISVQGAEHLTFDIYPVSDLSRAIAERMEALSKGTIKRYLLYMPFYIKVYSRYRHGTGSYSIKLERIRGTDRKSAIPLLPGDQFKIEMPSGLALKETWFEVEATDVASITRETPTLTFFAKDLNNAGSLVMKVFRERETIPFISEVLNPGASKYLKEIGRFFICIVCNFASRDIVCNVGIATNLTVLHGVHPAHGNSNSLQLHVVDETNPWKDGDDNIGIKILSDGHNIFGSEKFKKVMNFSQGEHNWVFRGLEQFLPDNGTLKFLREVQIQLIEYDFWDDDFSEFNRIKPIGGFRSSSMDIAPLPPRNQELVLIFHRNASASAIRPDPNSFSRDGHDGEYRFTYSLSYHAIIPRKVQF